MADDTTCFVKDKISLKNLIAVFKEFEICSGLKINLDKTIAKILGPGGRLNKKDGLTRYGNSHVKDKTS